MEKYEAIRALLEQAREALTELDASEERDEAVYDVEGAIERLKEIFGVA